MKIACPHCRAAFALDDKRVPAAGLSIKCPKCKQPFAVHRAKPGEEGKLIEGKPLAVPLPGGQQARKSAPGAGPGCCCQIGGARRCDDDRRADPGCASRAGGAAARSGAVPLPDATDGEPPPSVNHRRRLPLRWAKPGKTARFLCQALPSAMRRSGMHAPECEPSGLERAVRARHRFRRPSKRRPAGVVRSTLHLAPNQSRPGAAAGLQADDPFANIDIEVPDDPSAARHLCRSRPQPRRWRPAPSRKLRLRLRRPPLRAMRRPPTSPPS